VVTSSLSLHEDLTCYDMSPPHSVVVPSASEVVLPSVQCLGTTNSGAQCKHRVARKGDGGYCHQHKYQCTSKLPPPAPPLPPLLPPAAPPAQLATSDSQIFSDTGPQETKGERFPLVGVVVYPYLVSFEGVERVSDG